MTITVVSLYNTVVQVSLYDDRVLLLSNKTSSQNPASYLTTLHCENCIRFYLQERNHAVVQGNQTLIITLGKQHRYED